MLVAPAVHVQDADERLTRNRLQRWQRQSAARVLLPKERVAKCLRVRTREFVDVLRSKKFKRAHYGGLVTCGSVWMCPVCTAKVTERRRLELQQAIDYATAKGLSFFMATFTLQHTRQDRLKDVRDCLTDALTKTKSGRWYQGFTEEFEIIGNVTGSEVTFGTEHGWHFHKHAIYFTRQPIGPDDCIKIQKELSGQYERKLSSMGRYAHPIHGVDIRTGDSLIADYVAKYGHERPNSNWSLAAEVTKSFSKNALKSIDHFSPFELLDLFLHNEEQAGTHFQEYANAMKGTRQLRWSPGLRELLGLDQEMSDEELAAAQDDEAALFAQLTLSQWRKIIKKELRGQVLEVASTGNPEYLQVYLQSLK